MGKNHSALKMVEAMARIKVKADSFRWPPYCTGILHQPERPVNQKMKEK